MAISNILTVPVEELTNSYKLGSDVRMTPPLSRKGAVTNLEVMLLANERKQCTLNSY